MRRNKPKTLSIGSVSMGTTRTENLLPAFLDACLLLRLDKSELETVRHISAETEGIGEVEDGTEIESYIEDLLDILNNHCPDFCYFGANEGDGADFGCWISSEVPFHGDPTDEIAKGGDLPPTKSVKQDYFLLVNDHGNCTLYRKQRAGRGYKWRECWSLV